MSAPAAPAFTTGTNVSSIATATEAPPGAPFPKRKLILNAVDCIVPNHVVAGAWKGETEGHQFDTIEYWLEYAKLLEKGKSHGVFFADSYGWHDTYHFKNNP